jgi:phage baseplate assembly protein gpV
MSFAVAALAAAWVVHGDARAESPAIRRPNYQTATGTLASYDPATRMLTVRSAAGSKEFLVSADARLWLGRRTVPVSQLASRVGAEVTVAWSDVDGVRTTHTVRVSEIRPAGGR